MLDRIADALNDPKLRTLDYRIEGHTDAKGSIPYNQSLSERRAQAVRDYLITTHGISEHRLAAVGFGKTQPLPIRLQHPPMRRSIVGFNSVGLGSKISLGRKRCRGHGMPTCGYGFRGSRARARAPE